MIRTRHVLIVLLATAACLAPGQLQWLLTAGCAIMALSSLVGIEVHIRLLSGVPFPSYPVRDDLYILLRRRFAFYAIPFLYGSWCLVMGQLWNRWGGLPQEASLADHLLWYGTPRVPGSIIAALTVLLLIRLDIISREEIV